ncbi:MAG: tRNA 2-thiouridine(34) synthase MnmA [Spirochaetales bacterium]|nr:tRNA 2-thiouridine(34) synthase MnmA [Spirochaetales bacterium]
MKIAVLLSGGVDSSVVLYKLLEDGYTDITAYYLKIWLEDELDFMGNCPWEEDLSYAQAVCDKAGVELKTLSLQQEYYDKVVSYVIAELKEGRTPSPDIFCNQRIKFGAFYDHITENYDKVATGHYAQIVKNEDATYSMLRSPDQIKDQTYFLAHLSQEQISKIIFPIGGLEKNEVRKLAEKYDLPNKDRKDSQGICFLGKIKYNDFIGHYLGSKTGEIINKESGEVLGKHSGFWYHTVGQRSGLGLSGGPWYVVGKDTNKNIVYVSHQKNDDNREKRIFTVKNLNWLNKIPQENMLSVKLRHGPHIIPCFIKWLDDNRIEITMSEADKGVAPGQFAIFYNNLECLGCGRIE